MKNVIRTLVLSVLLTCSAASLKAQETFAPLITDNTVFFVHLDGRKLDLDSLKQRLYTGGAELFRELGFDKQSLRSTTRELKNELDKLDSMIRPAFETVTNELGIRELAVLVDLELIEKDVPLVVVVPWKNRSAKDAQKLADLPFMDDEGASFYVRGDFLFWYEGRRDWHESVRDWFENRTVSKDALIHQALRIAGDDEIKITAALPPSLRTMLLSENLLKDEGIPEQVRGLLMYAVQKIEWAGTSFSLAGIISDEPFDDSNVFLTVKTSRRSDAVQLRSLMENAIELGINMMRYQIEQEEGSEFSMPPLFFEFVKGFLRTLLPDIEGDKLVFRTRVDWGDAQYRTSIIAVGGVGIALLLPAVEAGREAARRMQCSNNIKKITLGLHLHHDAHAAFPPLYSADRKGKPLHSWRVLLLPFLDENKLYDAIRLDEPWDSEYNSQFHDKAPAFYRCPSARNLEGNKNCNYAGIAGEAFVPGKPGKPNKGRGMAEIVDGLNNTLGVIEVREPFCWMDPTADITMAELEKGINQKGGRMGSMHPGGCNAGFLDGSVRFLSQDIDKTILKALGARADE